LRSFVVTYPCFLPLYLRQAGINPLKFRFVGDKDSEVPMMEGIKDGQDEANGEGERVDIGMRATKC
jgi:hypothetical protein